MLKRLRTKFVCINMAIITVMLFVVFGMVLHFTAANLEDQSIQMMQAAAAGSVQPARPGEGIPVAQPYFMVETNLLGEITYYGTNLFDLSDEALVEDLLEIAFLGTEQSGVIEHYNLRYYRVVTMIGQTVVFADISGEQETMRTLIRNCAGIGLLAFVVFLLISLLLARWAVKPVDRAWTQQRQFVADASHELKTPLTVITTNAELLHDPDCTESERTRFTESILTMTHQMRGLVEGMLELARVDNGAVRAVSERLDMSELTENTTLPFEALFFEKQLMLDCRIEPELFVRGSAAHLRQVIEILLDNASKYAAGSPEVTLELRKVGRGQAQLCVANHASPMSDQELKDIFKRFYRADKVRSMNHSYGLGLSIAESIVKDHGGRIWAESRDDKILFYVQIPLE